MSRRRPSAVLVGSPVLVGTVTTLVAIVAIFLSYNANSGLPFVPTYDLSVTLPDAANLIRGNDVRIGGKRVGIISEIKADEQGGAPVARLAIELEQKVQPLRDDSLVKVRPRSALGLKYLEIVPGPRGEDIPAGGALALSAAQPVVELDHLFDAFDSATRRASQRSLDETAVALAGRGADVNTLIQEAPPLFTSVERVAGNLADPRTDLRGFVRGLDRAVSELALSADELGPLVESSDTTFGALDRSSAELAEGFAELPDTEAAATTALAAARPVLADTATLAREIRPGIRVLPEAGERLHAALETGIPVLRRTTDLSDRLESTLTALQELSEDPLTRSTLERLLAVTQTSKPVLEQVAPSQVQCNYLGLWTRNVASTISEGDNAGNWLRTLPVIGLPEMLLGQAEPSDTLHFNPYPNTAAPGQDGECEAGNEGYGSGRRLGNPAGSQGRETELTGPPEGVPAP